MRELFENALIRRMASGGEVAWMNPELGTARDIGLTEADIADAAERLGRFAPLVMAYFPETAPQSGLIESPLTPIPAMASWVGARAGKPLPGRLLLKQDSHLAVAGSIKARGGVYEVLKHAEDLALAAGLIHPGEDYRKLASPEGRGFFSRHTIQVGSTGNLGLSIGIMGAALGFRVVVHMSADARQWKKDLLREKGVAVMEYASDYGAAVAAGRRASDQDPMSYFVDDENSKSLFLGYAAAAGGLSRQLEGLDIPVDGAHPLFVYIPCGVGGAPGGVTFGLKTLYGPNVHCFFVEPVQAPCMLLGLATGRQSGVSVQDIGLSGLTHADGLAVGRPSGFVGGAMRGLVSGEFTVGDAFLYDALRGLLDAEGIFIEPSAAAAFAGPVGLLKYPEAQGYVEAHGLADKMDAACHVAWATGGVLVPEAVRRAYIETRL